MRARRMILFYVERTAALNLAFSGLLKSGDHVVTTAAEHNSVLRPLRQMQNQGIIDLSIAGVDSKGEVSLESIQKAIQETHASSLSRMHRTLLAAFSLWKPFQKCALSRGYVCLSTLRKHWVHSNRCSKAKNRFVGGPGHKGLVGC